MNCQLIFDVGLHKGEDSEFYLKKGFNVIGIEASSELCRYSERTLEPYISKGRMIILNYAISDSDHAVGTFYANESNSVWGTINKDWVSRNERSGAFSVAQKVDTIRLDTIMREYGIPYYLKIDIEGADLLALKQLIGLSDRPKYVSIESDKVSWSGLLEEFSILRRLGYTKFKIIDQLKVTEQESPSLPLEGDAAVHKFRFGSSGLFGCELPGRWMSYGECIKEYRKIFLRYRLFGDYGLFNKGWIRWMFSMSRIRYPDAGWFDTHATF